MAHVLLTQSDARQRQLARSFDVHHESLELTLVVVFLGGGQARLICIATRWVNAYRCIAGTIRHCLLDMLPAVNGEDSGDSLPVPVLSRRIRRRDFPYVLG